MRGIGIDLVAMCVNDVITCGAKPLYFLDYICTSDIKLHGDLVKHLVDGIAEGCKISGCSLLGGETAEHPRRSAMVDPIKDLAGFCTGIVEENEIIDGSLIRESDVIIGEGGILDTVKCFNSNSDKGATGLLFHDQTVKSLVEAIEFFKEKQLWRDLNPELIRDWSNSFSQDSFKNRFEETINRVRRERVAQRGD